MSKRISRLASSVQNPPAYWRDKSATFTVLPNQGEAILFKLNRRPHVCEKPNTLNKKF